MYLVSQQNLVFYHILAAIYPAYPFLCSCPHRPNKWHATLTLEDQGQHPSPSERPLSGIQGKQPNYQIEKTMTKLTKLTEVAVRIGKMNIDCYRDVVGYGLSPY